MATTTVDFTPMNRADWAGPYANAVAVTPNDATDLPRPALLYIGTKGGLKVTTLHGDVVVYDNVDGWLPVVVKRVWATGQNGAIATGIIANW